MSINSANFYVNGTSALDVNKCSSVHGIAFTAFKGGAPSLKPEAIEQAECSQKVPGGFKAAVRSILESSEMYCSLMLEDARGCSYRVFTKAGIATLSTCSAVVGVFALAFGA